MPFWFRRPPDDARLRSLALRTADFRQIKALWWAPAAAAAPRIAVVLMHPRVDFTHHYTVPRLVAAGLGVLAGNSRHVNNDTACEHVARATLTAEGPRQARPSAGPQSARS
jgi:hypothetical protein